MSADYFGHEYASNSDLKRLMNKIINGKEEPENLGAIYDQGTLNHQALTEPHLANRNDPNWELADAMSKTVLKDEMCRRMIMMHDFRREHEFYRLDMMGIKVRCKTDGDSKILRAFFEYKGLSVTTERAFDDAIDNFDYDQGIAFYLDTTHYDRALIAAVSKKKPDMLFKRVVDRNHKIYLTGRQKVEKAVKEWKMFFN